MCLASVTDRKPRDRDLFLSEGAAGGAVTPGRTVSQPATQYPLPTDIRVMTDNRRRPCRTGSCDRSVIISLCKSLSSELSASHIGRGAFSALRMRLSPGADAAL